MKLVSISTRYGGTRAVLCAKNNEEATWGLEESYHSSCGVTYGGTDTLRTAFSFASSSFFFCFNWFSFLTKVSESSIQASMAICLQPNVIWIQHPLDGCELSCFFGFSL